MSDEKYAGSEGREAVDQAVGLEPGAWAPPTSPVQPQPPLDGQATYAGDAELSAEQAQEEIARDMAQQRERLGEIRAEASKMPATQLFGMVQLGHGYIDERGERHSSVMLRQMTARQTSALVTGQGFDRDRLAHVLWECCESFGGYTKEHDGKKIREILDRELLLHERIQLIIMLRQLALGPIFDYAAVCPNPDCKHRGDYSVQLPLLERVGVVDGDPNNRVMLWKDLADRPWKVEWRFCTAADDMWFSRLVEDWKRRWDKLKPKEREEQYDPADMDLMTGIFLTRAWAVTGPDNVRHILRPLRHVARRDGDVVVADPIRFVLDLPQDLICDFAYEVDDTEPSIDLRVDFNCESCGADMKTQIYLGRPDFFSRSSRSRRATRG